MTGKQMLDDEVQQLRDELMHAGATREQQAIKAHLALRHAFITLRGCKPEDRSALDRIYQKAVTAIEDVWGSFASWANEDGPQMP